MTGLYFHLLPQTNISDWCSWAAGQMAQQSAPWVKTCSAEHIQWLRLYGARRVYWRPCFLPGDDGEGDCADGAAWGRIVAAEVARTGGHWPDCCGYRNEMNPTAANATQYRAYRAALRAAGFTGQVVYGSFSNGRPDWPEYATIPADVDALELHEYFGRTVAGSPDLALRHVEAIRRGLLPPTLPLYIGETGADDCGDGTGARGWRQKMPAAEMAAQLAAYRAGCAPSVVAAFVFADGNNGDPQWASYATRGTPVEQGIRATWADLPAAPPVTKEGHAMPAPLFQFTQDPGSSDCWCECIRSFFLRYGYPLDLDLVFQAGKGYPRPAGGEPATFSNVKRAIAAIAQQLGVKVQMADFDDPNTVAAALHDPDTANPWTVIAGVREADLQPGQNYGHFILLDHEDANGMVKVVDSYTNVDGDATEYYPFSQVAQAMIDNWEPAIDAIGAKIVQ